MFGVGLCCACFAVCDCFVLLLCRWLLLLCVCCCLVFVFLKRQNVFCLVWFVCVAFLVLCSLCGGMWFCVCACLCVVHELFCIVVFDV